MNNELGRAARSASRDSLDDGARTAAAVAPDDATRSLSGLRRPQPCLIDARSRGCDDAAPPTPTSLPVDASARGGDGKLLSPVPLLSPAHGARPNVSRFCCATKMLPERRRREPTKAFRANSKRMLARTPAR